MLGLGLSLQKGISAFNAGRALVSSYIRRVTEAGGVLQNTACDAAAINELNQDRLLEPASWVLVPDGIKEDVVFAQKPTSGLGDLQFTRASDATRTNSAGVIERTPWNLLQFSEQFDNAAWTKLNITITSNEAVSPTGTLTADKVVQSVNIGSDLRTTSTFSLVSGNTYTWSIYAKNAGYKYVRLIAWSSDDPVTTYDLDSISVVSESGPAHTSTIQDVGNGWRRLTITRTVSSAVGWVRCVPLSTANGSGTPNNIDGVYLWGAQVVEGTDAKPYFATTNRQDVPRLDYRNADGTLNSCPRLLLEPQRTNSIRNSTNVGAVAGSPGTFPTNWTSFNIPNLTNSVVGLGVENGLNYIDLRVTGNCTISSAHRFAFEQNTGIAATNGQTWTSSGYFKLISQIGAAPTFGLRITERTSAGASLISGSTPINLTSSILRYSFTRTLSGGATTAFAIPELEINVQGSTTYDFTIRIAAPQMELGAYATTFIPTTTAAVTRITDAASKTGISSLIGQTEGVIFLDFVFRTPATATGGQISITDQSAPFDRVLIWNNFTLNTLAANLQASGSTIFSTSLGTFVDGQRYKIAIAYKSGSNAGYVNGTQIFTNTNTFTFASTMTDIFLGAYEAVGMAPHQLLNQAALFKTRLTNAQLVDLTGGRIYYNPVEAYYAYYLTPEIPSAVITSVNSFF